MKNGDAYLKSSKLDENSLITSRFANLFIASLVELAMCLDVIDNLTRSFIDKKVPIT